MITFLYDVLHQFIARNGSVLSAGKVEVRYQGRTELANCYSDSNGTILANPFMLDNLGRQPCYVDNRYKYTIAVYDSSNSLQYTANIDIPNGNHSLDTSIISTNQTINIAETDNVFDLSINEESLPEVVAGSNIEVSTSQDGHKVYSISTKSYKVSSNSSKLVVSEESTSGLTEYKLDLLFDDSASKQLVLNDCSIVQLQTINQKLPLDGIASESELVVANNQVNLSKPTLFNVKVELFVTATDNLAELSFYANDSKDKVVYPIDSTYDHTEILEYNIVVNSRTASFYAYCDVPIDARISSLVATELGSSTSSGQAEYKVAVDSVSTPGYLQDVLESSSEYIDLIKQDGKLYIAYNSELQSDPKISSCNEFVINSNSSNYGSYSVAYGYAKPVWQDPMSVNWCNAKIYQCQRLSISQGMITKCNIFLTGSTNSSPNEPGMINVGLFDLDGNLLGSTGLCRVNEVFTNIPSYYSIDMIPVSPGSLYIKKNTRYYIQLWSTGFSIASYKRTTTNYTLDYLLKQNLSTTTSRLDFVDPLSTMNVDTDNIIPYISLGAI